MPETCEATLDPRSMEDEAIQNGFRCLKDGSDYIGLCNAAVCRAQADWLIGMNATRAYTTRYFKRLVVGRVQTPTPAMLTERKEKVENFQKEAYYKSFFIRWENDSYFGEYPFRKGSSRFAETL